MGLFTRIHPATSQFASAWLMFRKTMPKPSKFAFDKSVLFRHFSSCSLTSSSSSCFTSCQAQNQKSVYKHTSNDVERMTEPQYRWTLNVKGVRDGKFYFQQIDFMMITLFPSRYFHLSLTHIFNPIPCSHRRSRSLFHHILSGWVNGCLRFISANKGNNRDQHRENDRKVHKSNETKM